MDIPEFAPLSKIPKADGKWKIKVKVVSHLPRSRKEFVRPICHGCEKL